MFDDIHKNLLRKYNRKNGIRIIFRNYHVLFVLETFFIDVNFRSFMDGSSTVFFIFTSFNFPWYYSYRS